VSDGLFTPNSDGNNIDDNADYYAELVGDGKKFKDAQALARSKKEADAFIESLKRENSLIRQDFERLREEYNAVPRLQELVDQITNSQGTTSNNNHSDDENTAKQLSPEDLQKMIDQRVMETVNQTRTREQEEKNLRDVQAKLKERFGDAAPQALKSQIESMGLTEEFANDLARRHPAVFMKTFGLDNPKQNEPFQAPPSSSNRPSFTPSNAKRDWNYYEDLRKTKPDIYWDTKTQVQLHKDYMDQGASFGMPE